VLIGDGDPKGSNPRDIRVRVRGGGLCRINDAHCAYDPLHFVLFHPHGEPGWTPGVVEVWAGVGAKVVVRVGAETEALLQGASLARLLPRNTQLTSCMTTTLPPTYGERLYQEWVVDQYSKVEVQRLWWVRLNQTTLCVDQYKGMIDAVQQDGRFRADSKSKPLA